MDSATGQLPFYFQYAVTPKPNNELADSVRGCIATLIVFAKSGEKARERAGKFVADKNWEVTEVKRIQLLKQTHIDQMNIELKNVYSEAEQLGIGSVFDSW